MSKLKKIKHELGPQEVKIPQQQNIQCRIQETENFVLCIFFIMIVIFFIFVIMPTLTFVPTKTNVPTVIPTEHPSLVPSMIPSSVPTTKPSFLPTSYPSSFVSKKVTTQFLTTFNHAQQNFIFHYVQNNVTVEQTCWDQFNTFPLTKNLFEFNFNLSNCFIQVNKLKCINDGNLKTNFYINNLPTCGGIPLQKDFCVAPKTYSFPPSLNYENSSLAYSKPTCNTFEHSFNGTINGTHWMPENCSLIFAQPTELFRIFGKYKKIALISDSHIRNLFDGMICLIRNSTLCVDLQLHQGTFYYTFNETSDSLTRPIVIGENFEKNIFEIQFFWMPTWASLDLELIGKFDPDFMLISVGGWERHVHDDQKWRDQIDDYLENRNVKKFIFTEWPYGGNDRKRPFILNWMKNHTMGKRMEFYSPYIGLQILHGEQLRTTWHSLCSVKSEEIHAEDLCTGTIEKVSANIVLTSFAQSLKI